MQMQGLCLCTPFTESKIKQAGASDPPYGNRLPISNLPKYIRLFRPLCAGG